MSVFFPPTELPETQQKLPQTVPRDSWGGESDTRWVELSSTVCWLWKLHHIASFLYVVCLIKCLPSGPQKMRHWKTLISDSAGMSGWHHTASNDVFYSCVCVCVSLWISIAAFTCALQKEVLYHGKLFVSEGHVCFHSSVLLKDTKVMHSDTFRWSLTLAKFNNCNTPCFLRFKVTWNVFLILS